MVSVADAARLRANRHTVELTINAVPKVVIATAQINQSTFAYPLGELTVDGQSAGWSNVKVGQAFSLGTTPGGTDVLWGVVRKSPVSNTFFCQGMSLGDPGYPVNIIKGLDDDLYLTVYKHRPPWGLLSRILNKKFYKAFDVAYSNEGSNPNPVARLGQHRQADADPTTGLAQLTFTADPFTWGSKTITGHQWALDGGSVVSGSLTAASVTADFAPGFYVIEYTVTDSGSKTHTGFRYLWVNSTAYPAFGSRFPFEIGGDSQERAGRKLDITFYGQFTTDDIFPGQAFLVTETALFNGEPLDDETQRVSNYFGYLAGIETERTITTPSVTISLESPMQHARRLPAAPQQIVEKASPSNWTHVTSALSNPVGAVWYILQHHAPMLLAAHDFIFDASIQTLRKQSFVWQQDNIGAQLDMLRTLAQFATFGCYSDGSFVFKPSAVHLSTQAERNALTSAFTWDAGDIQSPLRNNRKTRLEIGEVKGGAFAYSGGSQATPFRSRAPGNVQAQGVGISSEFTVIVTTTQGQTRLNELTGHQFAMEAAEITTTDHTADRNLDIAEPCDSDVWHDFAFPLVYDPFTQRWVDRAIPLRVTRTWKNNGQGLIKTVSHTWQPDVFGQPGVTVPIERGGGQKEVQRTVHYEPKLARAFALAWNTAGLGARTFDFHSSLPHWELLMEGRVNDVTLKYDSEYFVVGTGALAAWVVTTSSTSLRIYFIEDVRSSVVVPVLQQTYTMADTTVITSARIASSKLSTNFVIVAWRCQAGTRVGRTTDGGTTWGSAVTVGETTTDADHDDFDIGLAVDGNNQLVTALHSDGSYYLYLATTTGGSFSRITASPASDAPYPLVVVDGEGKVFVRTVEESGSASSFTITWDSGGDPVYGTYSQGAATAGESTGGNPGDCWTCVYTGSYVNAKVGATGQFSVDADVPATCTSVSFDYKSSNDGAFPFVTNRSAVIIYEGLSGPIKTVTEALAGSHNTWITYTHTETVANCTFVRMYIEFDVTGSATPGTPLTMQVDNVHASIS